MGAVTMEDMVKSDDVIERLIQWGEQQATVRAMLLTSTRTNPNVKVDVFSDYDVVLIVEDIHPFFEDRGWLAELGPVLVVYRDPIGLTYGCERFAYITQYEDGTKIDYTIFPAKVIGQIVATDRLPDFLDVGYAVLLDKDRLTGGLKAPTYSAHIPTPPDETEYRRVIEEFFHEATYVAKHLWRDDLLPAKYNLDYAMKFGLLRQMLEWRIEIDHNWSVKPGAYGKGLKKRLENEIWAELESTYVGAGEEENWDALFRTINLFQRVAIKVGAHLGYTYPYEMHRRVVRYLQKVKNLGRIK
jgi:aminoglycoside 6-adenylyltransferase